VNQPEDVIARIGDAMSQVLAQSRGDPRIDQSIGSSMGEQWELGLAMATELGTSRRA